MLADTDGQATSLRPVDPSDRAACVAELTRLQRNLLPRLRNDDPGSKTAARKLLQDGTTASNGAPDIDSGLGRGLLRIVGNHSAAEICRERAITILRGLLQEAKPASSTAAAEDDEDDNGAGGDSSWYNWLVQFYVEYCSTVCRRIGSPRVVVDSKEEKGETSEQIRLYLVLTASDLLTLLTERKSFDDEEKEVVLEASSNLCLAIADGSTSVLSDPYPDLHRESCRVVIGIAGMFPSVLVQNASSLLRRLLGGNNDGSGGGLFAHRQAKTRCLALEAAAAVICCWGTNVGSETYGETISPQVETLLDSAHVLTRWEGAPVFDRSVQVRVSLQRAVGKVSRKLGRSYFCKDENQPLVSSTPCTGGRLLSLLLTGMSDEAENVKKVASDEMSLLYVATLGDDAVVALVADSSQHSTLLTNHANNILTTLLRDATRTWAAERRAMALSTATVLVEVLAESGNVDLVLSNDKCVLITSTLSACLLDDQAEVAAAARICAATFGRNNLSANLILDVVLESLQRGGERGDDGTVLNAVLSSAEENTAHFSDLGHFASTLILLECLLCGYVCLDRVEYKEAKNCLECSRSVDISCALCCEEVMDAASLNNETSSALLAVCHALIDAATSTGMFDTNESESSKLEEDKVLLQSSEFVVNLLVCSVYLIGGCGCDGNSLLSEATAGLLDRIVFMCNKVGIQSRSDLMRVHFRDILAILTSVDSSSIFGAREIRAFDALVRISGGSVVGENFDIVGPIFESHLALPDTLAKSSENQFSHDAYSTKLSLMALLESTTSDPSFSRCTTQRDISDLIENVVAPNLIWRVGGMAAALRKVTLATLFSILQNGNVTADTLKSLAPRLLPLLKSNVSDDDASTRELACHSIASLFEITPCSLAKEAVNELYLDIMKCLEDSADSVRIAGCGTLRAFLVAAPPPYVHGSSIKHIKNFLQIHSNDSNPLVQDAVMEVLQVLPSAVTKGPFC